MPSGNPKKKPDMATQPTGKGKSAEDELLDSVGRMLDEAAERMTHAEFMKMTQKAKDNLDRAIAEHSRRRGTA
jgi:hypothetical protein